jgi:large subunit ribosomal protein L18
MTKTNPRQLARLTRQARVRRKVRGTAERPRLCVFRSASHIYAQVVDDDQGVTLAAASTLSPDLKAEIEGLKKVEAAKAVGLAVAKAAKTRGCGKVVFDRNGFLYHGRVKALSEGAREGGLEF